MGPVAFALEVLGTVKEGGYKAAKKSEMTMYRAGVDSRSVPRRLSEPRL